MLALQVAVVEGDQLAAAIPELHDVNPGGLLIATERRLGDRARQTLRDVGRLDDGLERGVAQDRGDIVRQVCAPH
jgi:hypothetical protein